MRYDNDSPFRRSGAGHLHGIDCQQESAHPLGACLVPIRADCAPDRTIPEAIIHPQPSLIP